MAGPNTSSAGLIHGFQLTALFQERGHSQTQPLELNEPLCIGLRINLVGLEGGVSGIVEIKGGTSTLDHAVSLVKLDLDLARDPGLRILNQLQ